VWQPANGIGKKKKRGCGKNLNFNGKGAARKKIQESLRIGYSPLEGTGKQGSQGKKVHTHKEGETGGTSRREKKNVVHSKKRGADQKKNSRQQRGGERPKKERGKNTSTRKNLKNTKKRGKGEGEVGGQLLERWGM